jgi:hypothetical protein
MLFEIKFALILAAILESYYFKNLNILILILKFYYRLFKLQYIYVQRTITLFKYTFTGSNIQELTQPDDLMIPLMWPNVFDGQEGDTLYVEYEIEVPPEETEVNYPNSPGSAGDLSDFSGNLILYGECYT